jgi:cholera toxin transcriptional activator
MIDAQPVRGHRIYRFGIFELDTATLELRKDGRNEPRLREQTLQVLLTLLERPREIVTREEIRKRLWSSDTFVDFDHGLNTAVNQLRNTLGDSAANPRFIQTLPRRGYRFIAPVEVTGDGHAALELATFSGDTAVPVESVMPTPIDTPSQWLRGSLLSSASELPNAPNGLVLSLFSLIQLMYLTIYVVGLARLSKVQAILAQTRDHASVIFILFIVTASAGIPIRLYLLAASAFKYSGLLGKFLKLFVFLLPLDEFWALAPFLLVNQVGFGSAIAMTAALLYLPFAQRSLLLMGFAQL